MMIALDLLVYFCSRPSFDNELAGSPGAAQPGGGNLSDCACFFLKKNHRSSLKVVMLVIDRYTAGRRTSRWLKKK